MVISPSHLANGMTKQFTATTGDLYRWNLALYSNKIISQGRIFAEKKDVFFLKSYNCVIEYTRNERGKISGFVARTGTGEFRYVKIR